MSLKIISDGAGWVLDSIKNDFLAHTKLDINNGQEIIWAINCWSLKNIKDKSNVVAHLHHVNRDKLSAYDFDEVSKCKVCIVNNIGTEEFLNDKISCPIVRLPYWLLSDMRKDGSPFDLGEQTKIGYFQKDSENRTGNPKLIKGPDVFINVVKQLKDVKVILSGYNREYVIKELERLDIPYEYFKNTNNLSGLYDSIDWYFITSRCEGGPQSALEASYKKKKVLSTNVGIVSEVLHEDCICETEEEFVRKFNQGINQIEYNFENVLNNFSHEVVIPQYDELFSKLIKE
tara:strand:- start:2909 stop:3772 length:864 start_codon:yes stop_codon:yes gene_type:complete